MSATEQWRLRVEAHHTQSIKAQAASGWAQEDFWRPLSEMFRADPHRQGDQVLDRLVREVGATSTVLDVGGGAGRYALPLALKCRHVTVVEPSGSMVQALQQGVAAEGIDNISVVKEVWAEARVEPADVVLGANVIYGVADIGPFLKKLESQARSRVLILAYMESPPSAAAPLWKMIHGEDRINMPAIPQLMEVLWEMGIYPDLEMFPPQASRATDGPEGALEFLRHMVYVVPGTEKDWRLQDAVSELGQETPEGLVLRGSTPRRQALVSWRTG